MKESDQGYATCEHQEESRNDRRSGNVGRSGCIDKLRLVLGEI